MDQSMRDKKLSDFLPDAALPSSTSSTTASPSSPSKIPPAVGYGKEIKEALTILRMWEKAIPEIKNVLSAIPVPLSEEVIKPDYQLDDEKHFGNWVLENYSTCPHSRGITSKSLKDDYYKSTGKEFTKNVASVLARYSANIFIKKFTFTKPDGKKSSHRLLPLKRIEQ